MNLQIYLKKLKSLKGHFDGVLSLKVLMWLSREIIRRRNLRLDPLDKAQLTILSYPRSGNHAVRAILEKLTSAPTLGEGDSEDYLFPHWLVDRPLFLREPRNIRYPYSYQKCVAVKRHNLSDVAARPYLLYLKRDPVEAILSHTKELRDSDFYRSVEEHVRWWLSLDNIYENWQKDRRLNLEFRSISAEPELVIDEVAEFISKFWREHLHDRDTDTLDSWEILQRPAESYGFPKFYEQKYPQRAIKVRNLIDRLQ